MDGVHMAIKTRLLSKRLLTNRTLVASNLQTKESVGVMRTSTISDPYFVVNHLDVGLEVHEKLSITEITLLRSLDYVRSQMRRVVGSRFEQKRTVLALERFSSFLVDSLVLKQIDFSFVVLGAFVAEPRPLV
jgi:hypothetical protein